MNTNKILIIASVLWFSGCQNNKPTPDEATEEVEFLESEEAEEATEDYTYTDTTVNRVWLVDSKFYDNQIDVNSNTCYSYKDQKIFSDKDLTQEIGDIKKGEKVELTAFVKASKDKYSIIGDIVKVKSENGLEGYLYDGYLLPLPLPFANNSDLLDYALNHLHITDSVHSTEHKYGSKDTYWEMESSETHYVFESGIEVDVNGYYEGESREMKLNMLSMAEGIVFLDELIKSYNLLKLLENDLSEKSKEFEDEGWGPSSLKVEYDNNELRLIDFYFGDGCGDWISIKKEETGLLFTSGGGC